METLQMKLNRLAKESEQELRDMGFSDKLNKRIDYTISNAKSRLGQCCEKKHINISKWLLEVGTDKEIKNTIIHELLHTFDDTIGHKEKWKMYARKVNSYGVYNITRTTSISKIMKHNGVDEEEMHDMLNQRYEITCLGCGAVYYKSKIQSKTLNSYRLGRRYHTSCRSHNFKVVDRKTNEVIVNGVEE